MSVRKSSFRDLILATASGGLLGFLACWLLLHYQFGQREINQPLEKPVPRDLDKQVTKVSTKAYNVLPQDTDHNKHEYANHFGDFWDSADVIRLSDQESTLAKASVISKDSSRARFVEQLGIDIGTDWCWRIVFRSRESNEDHDRILVDASVGFIEIDNYRIGPRFICRMQEIWDVSESQPKLLDRIRLGELEDKGDWCVDGFDGIRTSSEAPPIGHKWVTSMIE
jgi:hypothetical protein